MYHRAQHNYLDVTDNRTIIGMVFSVALIFAQIILRKTARKNALSTDFKATPVIVQTEEVNA